MDLRLEPLSSEASFTRPVAATRRAGASTGPTDANGLEGRLDGDEVVEITLFADKKEWIEDKIKFLSTLPPILYDSPLPPEPSSTSKEELEQWWNEHEEIERQVAEFDVGDLAKMRMVAKNKSKQALSRRDTDLIEVCLTTIFAIDKLLHLLRQRRKALVLVGYRLRWEESLRAAWSSHAHLIDEFAAFLSKSIFQIPSSQTGQTANATLEGRSESEHANLAPDRSLSLSASTSSRRLSALASSTSMSSLSNTSGTSSGSSSMSRTMRSQMLLLSLNQMTTHARHLVSTLVPASSKSLDLLIDNATSSVPDPFLDEQDRLEDKVGNGPTGDHVERIARFGNERIEEWKVADRVYWTAVEAEKDSTDLERVVEEELKKVSVERSELDQASRLATAPEARNAKLQDWIGQFERRLEAVRASLDETSIDLASLASPASSRLPHPLAPAQVDESRSLAHALSEELERSRSTFTQAESAVARFRKAIEVVGDAKRVRARLGALVEEWRALQSGVGALGTEPRERTTGEETGGGQGGWLEPTPEETAFEQAFELATGRFDGLFGETDTELKKGIQVVAVLGQLGIDPNARREVGEVVQGVAEVRRDVEMLVKAERETRERIGKAREVGMAVRIGRSRIAEAMKNLRKEAEGERWVDGPARDSKRPTSVSTDSVEELSTTIRRSTRLALDAAKSLFKSDRTMLSRLETLVAPLNPELDQLSRLSEQVRQVSRQRTKVEAFEAERLSLENPLLTSISKATDAIVDTLSGVQTADDRELELERTKMDLSRVVDEVASQLARLSENAHARVPFLDSSATRQLDATNAPLRDSTLLPFDVVGLDHAIRQHVNESLASAHGSLEEAQNAIRQLDLASAVARWDAEMSKMQEEIVTVEGKLGEAEEELGSDGASEEKRSELSTTLAQLLAAHEALQPKIERVSAAFDDELLASPHADDAPFRSFASRRAALDKIIRRASEIPSRIGFLTERLNRAKQDSQDRRAQWLERRDQLEVDLGRQGEELCDIRRLVEETKRTFDDALAQARIRRADLMRSSLPERPDNADHAFVAETRSTNVTLRSRLEDFPLNIEELVKAATSLESDRLDYGPVESTSPLEPLEELRMNFARTSKLVDELDLALDGFDDDTVSFGKARGDDLERRRLDASAYSEPGEDVARLGANGGVPSHPSYSSLGIVGGRERDATITLSNSGGSTSTFDPFSTSDSSEPFAPSVSLVLDSPPLPPLPDLPSARSSISTSSSSASSTASLVPDVDADVFGLRSSRQSLDPFAASVPTFVEPASVAQLRRAIESVPTSAVLDAGVALRLPTESEARDLVSRIRELAVELDELEASAEEDVVWTDFSALKLLLKNKEDDAGRVQALVRFSHKVGIADTALSHLLDSIDAVNPALADLSLDDEPPLVLTDAIIGASDAVTSVRLEAIPLVDDARVEQAIERIEESWAEMMAMVDDVHPRAASVASSTSSRATRRSTSQRTPARHPVSGPTSRTPSRSSSISSASSLGRSRQNLPARSNGLDRSVSRSTSSLSSLSSSTRSHAPFRDASATPRRRVRSGLPVATPRRNSTPPPALTPTAARPFSFASSTRSKRMTDSAQSEDLSFRSPLSTPRRADAHAVRDGGGMAMRRLASGTSNASSRRDSLSSSVSSRRSSLASSVRHAASPAVPPSPRFNLRFSPSRPKKPYRPNLRNKLDRQVGSIVNQLDIHVPIEQAEGTASTDESGMYRIGDKVFFLRILRSKQVMVRVGGGWLNLLQFILTHFGISETVDISPTTPVKRLVGNEPRWISSPQRRSQLSTSQSSASLQSFLSSSTSSDLSGHGDRSLTTSVSMRKSLSGSATRDSRAFSPSASSRRSLGESSSRFPRSPLLSPTISTSAPRRPPIPTWKP
ncbi:hypothetical protein JCM10212_004212 [Sporobolomyces blumeae]